MNHDSCDKSSSEEVRKTLTSLLNRVDVSEKVDKHESSSFEVLQSASSLDGNNIVSATHLKKTCQDQFEDTKQSEKLQPEKQLGTTIFDQLSNHYSQIDIKIDSILQQVAGPSYSASDAANPSELFETLRYKFDLMNQEAAQSLIDEMVANPQVLGQRWFTNKLMRQSEQCQHLVIEWIERMNKTQQVYIDELTSANTTLRSQVKAKENGSNFTQIEGLIRESYKIENFRSQNYGSSSYSVNQGISSGSSNAYRNRDDRENVAPNYHSSSEIPQNLQLSQSQPRFQQNSRQVIKEKVNHELDSPTKIDGFYDMITSSCQRSADDHIKSSTMNYKLTNKGDSDIHQYVPAYERSMMATKKRVRFESDTDFQVTKENEDSNFKFEDDYRHNFNSLCHQPSYTYSANRSLKNHTSRYDERTFNLGQSNTNNNNLMVTSIHRPKQYNSQRF